MATIVDGTAGVTGPGTGSVVLTGSTSGTATIVAPAVAGTTTITLPSTTGTFITTTGGVTPGSSGNLLTSNGTSWTSAAPSGGVTSIVAGTGITVSGATGAVTVNTIVSSGGVGTYMLAYTTSSTTKPTRGTTYAGSTLGGIYFNGGCCCPALFTTFGFSGTWRAVSPTSNGSNQYYTSSALATMYNAMAWLFQRTV
jgi:hypothetical protein